jgi:hypothetical protein
MPCEHTTYFSISVRTAAFMWTDLHYQDARSRLGGNSLQFFSISSKCRLVSVFLHLIAMLIQTFCSIEEEHKVCKVAGGKKARK